MARSGVLLLSLVASVVSAISPILAKFKEDALFRQRERARLSMPAGLAAPTEEFFNQTLNHFDVLNSATFKQRYWVNDQYFTNGSTTLFLYIEGEGAGSPYDVMGGQHFELAAAHNALIIAIEHRYYGATVPTPDFTTDNMVYLSSHQAIADIARFLNELVPSRWNVTRTVTFGGSYSGALSAWTRIRLPHLVYAAFSTSSPVEAIIDFTGYCDTVSSALSSSLVGGSPLCRTALAAAFAGIDAAFRGSDAQKTAMSTKMKSCAAALTTDDVMWAASNLAGVVQGIVQYNDESGSLDIASVCKTLTAGGVDPVDAFASVVGSYVGGGCMDNSWPNFLKVLTDTKADPNAGGVGIRAWTWQTCAQFGYYQACENGTQCPFSTLMTLDSNFQACTQGFDSRVRESVNRAAVDFTNDYMGAKLANETDRILWVNGGIDPWHTLSVLPGDLSNKNSAAVWIPSGAHCRAMQSSRANDPQDVKDARALSAATLAAWLAM